MVNGWALNCDRITGVLAIFGFEMNGGKQPLVIMYNMLYEHFFAGQSLLKEQRRPTGGLREACKESLEGVVPTPSSPSGAFATRFPPTWGERWILLGME